MEGEDNVLSSSLWPALKGTEYVLTPNAHDSPIIARLRNAMLDDHSTNRMTLAKSIQSKLHVLMHLLDPR
jgi:hypothetical protein